MKKGLTIKINFTNRWLYTFIAIGILAVIGVGVYAATYTASGAGHPYTEISTCPANQILKMNAAGTEWECSSLSATETDPTVMSWAKNSTPTFPLGLEIVEGHQGYGKDQSVNVHCPAGKKIISGGCWCGSSSVVGGSYIYNSMWVCSCEGSGSVTGYAICARAV